MFDFDRMNALIKKSGKTKLFLCGQLGKGKTYLRDAEKQKTNISGETLRILASELNTTPEYLTGETDDPGVKKEQPTVSDGLTDEQRYLIDLVKSASPEQATQIFQVLKVFLGDGQ